jgi:uncharacterized protein (TIGR04551 family)
LALSDDVRMHMTIDVLDNVALGSSPDRVADGTGVDDESLIDLGSGGVSSTSTGDAFRDSIYVRRAWAEVTNRALGQLRFGRMAHEWGLGMLYNAGDGLDDDYSSEIDRIQAITRYSDLFFGASYDFAGEGVIMSPITSCAPCRSTSRTRTTSGSSRSWRRTASARKSRKSASPTATGC